MDQLPDELIELIMLSSTCQSLGRLSQTAGRYQQIIQPWSFWRTKLRRDYPEMVRQMKLLDKNQDSDWLISYQQAYSWHRKVCQEFPTLIREAEYLVRTKKYSWKKVYLNLSLNPLLVYPNVRKICFRLDCALNYPTDGFTPGSVARRYLKPHLELTSNNALYFDLAMRRYDLVFIIPRIQEIATMFNNPGALPFQGPLFGFQPPPQLNVAQLLAQFRDFWTQQNLTATVEMIRNREPQVCLQIHGSLQTLPNGAQIWVPKPYSDRPFSNQVPANQN